MTKYDYEEQADIFCDAIRRLAENEDALDNLRLYLSIHFPEWLSKRCTDPDGLALEMDYFSKID